MKLSSFSRNYRQTLGFVCWVPGLLDNSLLPAGGVINKGKKKKRKREREGARRSGWRVSRGGRKKKN